MERRRELVIFIAIVLLAFTLEFLKGMGKVEVRDGNRLTGKELKGLDSKPFSRIVDKDGNPVNTRGGFKLSKAAGPHKVVLGQFDSGDEAGKARMGTAAKIADKKKKKKKKSKKSPTDPSGPHFDVKVYGDEREKIVSTNTPIISSGSGSPQAQTKNEDADVLQKWLDKLLARPDKSLTLDFIREYQSGKITPAVFYAVVDAFLNEDHYEFHEMGVYCASETPSPRSYGILTSVISSGDFGPAAVSMAVSESKAYEMLQLLWVPKNIIAGRTGSNGNGAENILTLAANTIERSTFRYLSQTPNSGGSQVPSSFYSKQAENVFKALAPVLEKAIETHRSQASIATPLQTALDRIRQSSLVAANITN